ncbi:hypothetical protein [Coraliomargarita parva]|uniref:hypothetical protein n=1 Tax=Coraliomargarita parva TaxID=3014050 RepID=UPI0022B40367|nr:hypothetical protein [Coraliomargarita parva]
MKCSSESCNKESFEMVEGIPYCKAHRDDILFTELEQQLAAWELNSEPPARFCYLLGRLSDDFKIEGESYLSPARIRQRGFNWRRVPNGCTFEITRHPGAWTQAVAEKVVQQWRADIETRELHLIGEREFKDGDLDRDY